MPVPKASVSGFFIMIVAVLLEAEGRGAAAYWQYKNSLVSGFFMVAFKFFHNLDFDCSTSILQQMTFFIRSPDNFDRHEARLGVPATELN